MTIFCRYLTSLLVWKFVVVFIIFTLFPKSILAVEYGGIGGRPAFPRSDNPRTESIFIHILNPGQIQEEGVLVVNNTQERKTLLVYGVDSVYSSGGAFACGQMSDEKKGVGKWLSLGKTEVALDPGTNEMVPFTIQVPKDTSVGEHNGCIVIQEKKEKSEDQEGMKLSFRTGLRVAITIPGEITRKLEIIGFKVKRRTGGDFLLVPTVNNLGNVSIDADVKVITKYFFGLTLIEHGGRFPILRGSISDWNFELKKPFWGGWYRSSLFVEYDENQEAGVGIQSGKELTKLKRAPVWFFSFPTPTALAIEIIALLCVVVLVILFWLSKKRKKWIAEKWVEYEVKRSEDIKTLAEKFDVSWKLLARVNKLKPPYVLNPEEKIKVPPSK